MPASVLIGLALLPFAIPIFWLVAPAVVGREPAMSIATPSALAISASVLCLAVIYTVDWTPTTRIKGVLMLVGLAYFSAVSLYFVKKGIVEKFQRFTGLEEKVEWQELKREHYKVLMPGPPREVPAEESPLQTLVKLNCVEADHEKKWFGEYRFVVGSAKLADQVNANGPKPGTKAWFEAALGEVESRFGGKKSGGVRRVEQQGHQGPQWEIRKVPTGPTRLVRLFVIRGRVYYLSVEGQHLQPNDILVQSFFRSLDIEHAND